MDKKALFIINTILTCLTMILILSTCQGCNQEQAEQAQIITQGVNTGLMTAGPAIANQPWYVIALLIADISTSVAAAVVAYWKAKNPS